jgi:hypothetical protein
MVPGIGMPSFSNISLSTFEIEIYRVEERNVLWYYISFRTC